MSKAMEVARAGLIESSAEVLTRDRARLQAEAEAAGMSPDEIGDALNSRPDLPRPLTAAERDALEGVLRHGRIPSRDILLLQAAGASVIGYCGCGCATVDLQIADDIPPAGSSSGVIPSTADVLSEAGDVIGGLTAFIADGYLSMLEIYAWEDPISPIPPLTDLRFS